MVNQNSNPIPWREEFSVGIAEIDDQHKELLELLNQLNAIEHDHTGQNPESSPLAEALERFNHRAGSHFDHEEALMQKHLAADENTADHLVAHRSYWSVVVTLRNRLMAGDEKTSRELLQYVNRWWINHILQIDQEMGRSLTSLGIR